MRPVPCLVIAGVSSGVGKTSVATALMSSYTRRGLTVQPFKVGPDFIDPTFHVAATGRPSHNLDGWMLQRTENLTLYARASEGADLCIVEGVMGLFDGKSAHDDAGSTAEMAKWLRAPVILLGDGSAMARSAAALVHGYESFDPDLTVAGVIFNRVSSDKHYSYLHDSVAARCKSRPLGYLPTDPGIALPERHLGLKLAAEVLTPELLARLSGWIERTVDTNALLELARSAKTAPETPSFNAPAEGKPMVRIGVAKDPAFQFYYEDNLQQLQKCGAELIEFSPISDSELPAGIDALYLGGGYPELHAPALARNHSMRASIVHFAERGSPVYAECGGFMYLTEAIVDQDGHQHEMCGIFPTRARMQPRLAALGYAELEVLENVGWLKANQRIRGHEFRYSLIDEMPGHVIRAYTAYGSRGTRTDGFISGGVLGSYFHLHFASCPSFAEQFIAAAIVPTGIQA